MIIDGITPVFLWTDLMIWFLFALLIIGVVQIRKDQQKAQQWRSVFESKTAIAAALVLLFYFMVALADSIHFKVDPKQTAVNKTMISGLDMLFSHLSENSERTYSAPFALNEYSSSVVFTESGDVAQEYLPLKHVIQDLNGDSTLLYVLQQSSWAMMISLILLVVFMVFHGYQKFKALAHSKNRDSSKSLPWGTFYLTLFSISFIMGWLYILSFDFHVLGTNKVGEDVFYQSLKSIRTGVIIGGLTTLVMLPLALALGISAGYFKGLDR